MARWGTKTQLAVERGVTRQRVQIQLRDWKGKPNKQGKIDLDKAGNFIDEHFDQTKKPREKTPKFLDSQAKKEAAVAELKQLEVDQKKGELVSVQECRNLFFKIGRQVRDAILAQENRMPGVLEGKDRRSIKTLLHKENVKVLHVFDELHL